MKITTSLSRTLRSAAPIAATALLIAACGSTSSGASAAAAVNASAAPTTATASAAAGAAVTVETHAGPLGTYLTDKAGKALYLWVADTKGTSTCSGACATAWPPLIGTPTAAGSASQSALGTVARSDGSKQVTYDGHPLYYFVGDKAAGTTAGQGSNAFGAAWWVVNPAGKAITAAASTAGSAASTSAVKGY
jgi:predicted lipoprotein with Yx(FWY)xxD motif